MRAIGAIFVFLGILSGSLSAHILRATLGAEELIIFDRAVLYLLVHGVALLALSAKSDLSSWNIRILLLGLVIFVTGLISRAVLGAGTISAIAPFGGTLLLIGWAWTSISEIRRWRVDNER